MIELIRTTVVALVSAVEGMFQGAKIHRHVTDPTVPATSTTPVAEPDD